MATPLNRWNDERLDDLRRRVDRVEPLVESVAVLGEQMKSLARDVRANTVATQKANDAAEGVSHQLEQARLEPLTRARTLWGQVAIVVVAATTAGLFSIIGALIASGQL